MTIWDCQTHVPMTSMTSSVEWTDLDFKISVALVFGIIFGIKNILINNVYFESFIL